MELKLPSARAACARDRVALAVFVLVFVTLLGAGEANAQASAVGNAYAEIVTPLTLNKYQDLDFGQISVGAGGGHLRVNADGSVETHGGVVSQGGSPSAAAFEVTGESGLSYDVTLPSQIEVSDGAGNQMRVRQFEASNGGTGSLTGGSDDFTVGATLGIAADQPPGAYAGTFNVTVAYQ